MYLTLSFISFYLWKGSVKRMWELSFVGVYQVDFG